MFKKFASQNLKKNQTFSFLYWEVCYIWGSLYKDLTVQLSKFDESYSEAMD